MKYLQNPVGLPHFHVVHKHILLIVKQLHTLTREAIIIAAGERMSLLITPQHIDDI